jgi:hypothetical protein
MKLTRTKQTKEHCSTLSQRIATEGRAPLHVRLVIVAWKAMAWKATITKCCRCLASRNSDHDPEFMKCNLVRSRVGVSAANASMNDKSWDRLQRIQT